jgi:type IV secretory pathway VirB2 component (pilin)
MGGGGSQTINQTFNLSAINKSIFEKITKNKAESLASQANIQNLEVVMRNVRGCSASFGQTIDASTQSSSELTQTQTDEIKNAITNDMKASASAAVEKATQMGNMQFGDKQNVNQNVTLAIENVIENKITTENINRSVAEQVSIQNGKLVIDGYDCSEGGDISWDQDVTAKLMSEAITKSLSDAIASSEVLNSLHAAASGSSKTENKGLAEVVDSLFAGLTGPIKYAMIACVVCCCLLVLVMIVLGLSPAGQSATKNLGAAGASRLGGARRF